MPAKTWAPPKGVSVDWEIITPAVAAEYLDQNTDNRHLRSRAVDMYTRNMLAGEWKVTGETIKFDRNGRLIDGQHRLAAIIRAEKQQPCLVVRGLEPEVQGVIDTNLHRIDAEAADSFLEAITEFKTEGENDPRTTLIRAFSLSTYSHRPGITIGLMFTTWNAWRSGQILRSLPLVDAKGKQLVIPEPI
jgi:hypothetical protein